MTTVESADADASKEGRLEICVYATCGLAIPIAAWRLMLDPDFVTSMLVCVLPRRMHDTY